MFWFAKRQHWALLLCGTFFVLGCDSQTVDARLASPETVHWEDAQLLVEGRGFPAGAKGLICLKGRWVSPESRTDYPLDRCVDAWALAEDQVVSAWPAQGAFHGSLSLQFSGLVANVHGSLEEASFVAGAGTSLASAKEDLGILGAKAATLASWSALLLFLFAITRTRVGAGLFMIGQALGNKRSVSTRALFIAAATCTVLSLTQQRLLVSAQILAAITTCAHPVLMSWLRGERSDARSIRALLMWIALSLAVVASPKQLGWPTLTQLVLLSFGIFALLASHAWIKRRRVTDDLTLGLGAWFVAQIIVGPLPIVVALALCIAWVGLRAAPLFHWTVPSFVPCALCLGTIGGLELLSWLHPPASEWSSTTIIVALSGCVVRIIVDIHGSVRQLSPIGAPDQTLPDLTLA